MSRQAAMWASALCRGSSSRACGLREAPPLPAAVVAFRCEWGLGCAAILSWRSVSGGGAFRGRRRHTTVVRWGPGVAVGPAGSAQRSSNRPCACRAGALDRGAPAFGLRFHGRGALSVHGRRCTRLCIAPCPPIGCWGLSIAKLVVFSSSGVGACSCEVGALGGCRLAAVSLRSFCVCVCLCILARMAQSDLEGLGAPRDSR